MFKKKSSYLIAGGIALIMTPILQIESSAIFGTVLTNVQFASSLALWAMGIIVIIIGAMISTLGGK